MFLKIKNYKRGNMIINFRKVISVNDNKTSMVIMTYISIMVFVGLLVDTIFKPLDDSLMTSLYKYITFESLPVFTLIIFSITLAIIYYVSNYGSKMMLNGLEYKCLSEEPNLDDEERKIVNMVEEMSIAANLGYVPKIYVCNTESLNAFAAGWNKDNAIICINSGLYNRLERNEVLSVIAHEVGHLLAGDAKLTLYIGILTNILLNVSSMFAGNHRSSSNSNSKSAAQAKMILFILNLVLPIITSLLYFYLSRTREYVADAISVKLTGDPQSMINALEKISNNYVSEDSESSTGERYRNSAYIFNPGDGFFSTHPSIENRIDSLNGEKNSFV
jgi:heat shock protein HtpX